MALLLMAWHKFNSREARNNGWMVFRNLHGRRTQAPYHYVEGGGWSGDEHWIEREICNRCKSIVVVVVVQVHRQHSRT